MCAACQECVQTGALLGDRGLLQLIVALIVPGAFLQRDVHHLEIAQVIAGLRRFAAMELLLSGGQSVPEPKEARVIHHHLKAALTLEAFRQILTVDSDFNAVGVQIADRQVEAALAVVIHLAVEEARGGGFQVPNQERTFQRLGVNRIQWPDRLFEIRLQSDTGDGFTGGTNRVRQHQQSWCIGGV